MHFDALGLIVQADGDGGDTAQREGWYWFGAAVLRKELNLPVPLARAASFEQVLDLLEVGQSGVFRRHPNQWSDPKDFSRDQMIPLIAAMGLLDDHSRLLRLRTSLAGRGWLAQNGDLFAPEHRSLLLRSLGEAPEALGDVQLVGSVATRLASAAGDKDNVGDDLNLLVMLLMASLRDSSEITKVARELYAKNRPISYGCFLETARQKHGSAVSASNLRALIDDGIAAGWQADCPRVLGALRWYFRTESGGNSELANMYEPIVRRWFE